MLDFFNVLRGTERETMPGEKRKMKKKFWGNSASAGKSSVKNPARGLPEFFRGGGGDGGGAAKAQSFENGKFSEDKKSY